MVDFVRQIDKGKNVFVIGGNSLVGPLLDADLFDHLIIQIAPLILGKGVPLFTQEEGQRFYQLDSLRQFGPFAERGFQPKKSEIEKGVDRMLKFTIPCLVICESLSRLRTAKSRCMFVGQPCITISTWGMPVRR